MPPPNGAGDLPEDRDLTGVVTVKKGNIEENPRRGERKNITVKVSDGFPVLKARMEGIVQGMGVQNNFLIYFKRTKTAVQSDYGEMHEANFAEWLRMRWSKITATEVTRWAEEGKSPEQMEVFKFFVYKPRNCRQRLSQLRRATQANMADARERLREHDIVHGIARGPIERAHLAVTNARRPEGAPLELGNDNTTTQARRLDVMQQEMQNEDEQAAVARNNEYRPITFKFNGTDMEVEVKIQSLRAALGLPLYDLFQNGVFHGYQHETVARDEDENDDEHENPQPGAVGAL